MWALSSFMLFITFFPFKCYVVLVYVPFCLIIFKLCNIWICIYWEHWLNKPTPIKTWNLNIFKIFKTDHCARCVRQWISYLSVVALIQVSGRDKSVHSQANGCQLREALGVQFYFKEAKKQVQNIFLFFYETV